MLSARRPLLPTNGARSGVLAHARRRFDAPLTIGIVLGNQVRLAPPPTFGSCPEWDLADDRGAVRHRVPDTGTYGRLYSAMVRVEDRPMIESLGNRLRVVFGSSSASEDREPDVPRTAARSTHHVEFVAYGEDCVLSGFTRMDADRLTDMLNEHEEYQLVDVLVEGLLGEEAVEAAEVIVKRDELFLVHAAGPRGNQDRRRRTRSHPVAIQMGPYHIRGYVHTLPGADPVQAIRRRNPMVPLTDAWIEFAGPTGRQRRRVGTVVVNREQIDWIVPAMDDEVEMPDLPLSAEKGALLKDFTGALSEGL